MTKFRCKHTGNVFTFTALHDIKTMREHQEYEEVKEEVIEQKSEPQKRTYNKRQHKDKL